jgi:ABC-type glycerol-3-phosphate transport system substrate-binding protein
MFKSRKLSFLISLVLIAAVVIPSMAVSAQPPQTITYASYQSDPEPKAFDEMVVSMWNEAHPTMPIEHSQNEHEGFKQAIRTYLTADPAPDVLTWFAGNRARFFIDRGLIAPISDVWAEQGWDESYSPGFNAMAEVDGEKYFLPTDYYWWAIYYRPSLFEQAGIESEPATWDELLGACDALNAIGVTPFTIGTKFRWTAAAWFDYINMRVNGPQFHLDLMLLKEQYNDPRVREVFTYWDQLFEHDCFIDDPAAYSWQEAVDFIANEEAGMYLMGAFIVDTFPDEKEDDLDFFQFPIINPDVPVGEDAPTDGYFMAVNAGNPEGGKAFLAFLGSAEVQQLRFNELGRLPTRVDIDLSAASDATRKGVGIVQSADLVVQFYDRDTTPPMADAGMNGLMDYWDDPSSVDQILEDLEVERLRVLEEEVEE